jgi:tape measure domain-containing protein
MSSVDDRVVNMKFDNTAFERGARVTLGTLDKLKESLKFSGSQKALSELDSAAGSKTGFNKLASSVDNVKHHIDVMRIFALTAIATIAHRIVNVGINLTKALTINPIKAGFENYETQIKAVQTILANTGLKGAAGLSQVTGVLNQLNTYANQTVYNFSEMAKNIGTFTAAGVGLKPAAESIKGIANLAALSGSTSEQASTAMYQLSQAIAAGQVKLQDWNSVVNAGLGGKIFQRALFNTAKAMGTLKDIPLNQTFDQWTKAGNTFRGSLQDGWVTGKVLTSTLSQFTGDLTAAQLKSMGFNAEQIKQIQELGKTATDAAVKVKTMSQLTQALKEEVATAWAAVFKTIFGNITDATVIFSKAHIVMENALTAPIYALNKLLEGWQKLGGRAKAIDAVKNAVKALHSVLDPIKNAWRDIFPPTTGKMLYNLTVLIDNFTKRLSITSETGHDLQRTFRGIFAVFDILGQVVSGVFHVFGTLFGLVSGGGKSVLHFTGNIGDMLVALDKALKEGGQLNSFFTTLQSILAVPIHLLGILGHILANLFTGFSGAGAQAVAGTFHGIGVSLAGFTGILTGTSVAWNKLSDAFTRAKARLAPIGNALKKMFSGLGNTIKQTMSSAGFDNIVKLFNTVLLGGIALAIKKFLGKGIGINVDVGHGVFGKIGESFESLTKTLKVAQTQLKAKTLLEIGAAIALLTASVVALSLINPAKLEPSIKALAVLFAQLLIGMNILTKITASAGLIKLPVIAASMNLLATSILILTVALKSLAKLDWTSLKKGLTAVGILLGELAAAATLISVASGNMARTSAGILALAVAVRILATAVKAFSSMSWKELLKGLTGVAGALLVISVAMRAMPPGLAVQGVGLLAISIGLKALASAVSTFSQLNLKDLGKGLLGIASSMGVIAGAMRLMPKSMVTQAAALILIGIALKGIASAVAQMGSMDWKTIGKGVASIAGALLVLAGALQLMQGSLGGAVALGIAAAALSLFVPTLRTLGRMSWTQIAKGLVGLAGTFAVLGAAALILSPATAAIAALGLALLAFSAAVALAGVGILAMGKGFEALARGGTNGVAVLLKALDGFIERLPAIGKSLALGLVNFIGIIAKNAPAMIESFGKIISSIFQAIIDALPTALKLFEKLIETLLEAIVTETPKIVSSGGKVIVSFLEGVAKKIPDIVRAAADCVVAFLDAIGRQAPRIIGAGLHMVVRVLNGIADGINKYEPQIIHAGLRIGIALILGIPKGIGQAFAGMWRSVKHWLSSLWNNILDFFGIASPSKKAEEIGKAILDGMWVGIQKLASWFWNKVKGWAESLWNDITDFFGIGGPSMRFAGLSESWMTGLVLGIDKHGRKPIEMMNNMGRQLLDGFNNTVGTLNANPSITPVLDLSNIQKDAGKISGLLSDTTVTPTVSIDGAKSITDVNTSSTSSTTNDSPPVVKEIKLEQNNYSPKALSAVEIYRNTKNQISLAKEALTKP